MNYSGLYSISFAVCLFFFAASSSVHAATFYVSTTSDGTGTVNSIDDPYPSVRTAVYAAFSHSDASSEVRIRAGTYNQSENIFQRDFTAAGKSVVIKPYPNEDSEFYPTDYLVSGLDYAWRFVGPSAGISVEGDADGGSITLDGENMLATELTDNTSANARALHDKGLLQLTGSNFSVKGLEIRNSHGRGVQFTNSTNVTIQDNYVHHTKTRAIGGSGDTITITGNEVHDAVLENYNQAYNQDGDGSNDPDDADGEDGCGGWAGAISTVKINSSTATTNVVINDNTVYDNWGEGIIPFDSRYVEIKGNTVYNNYSVNLYVEAVQDAVVTGNYVSQTSGTKRRDQNADCPLEPARETYGISVANEARVVDGIPEVVAYTDKMVIANNVVIGGEASLRFWFDESNTAATNTYKNLLVAHNVFWKPASNVLLIGCVVAQDSGASCTHTITGDEPENARFMNNLISRGTASYGTVHDPTAWTFSHNHWVEGDPAFTGITQTSSTTGEPNLNGGTQNPGDSADNFKLLQSSSLAQSGTSTTGLVPDSIEYWSPSTAIATDYFGTSFSTTTPSRGFHEQIPAVEDEEEEEVPAEEGAPQSGGFSASHFVAKTELCTYANPSTEPKLFLVTTRSGAATLHFVAANDSNDHLIEYGVGTSTDMYAVSVPVGQASGVLSYTIYDLEPNGVYSFRMRGGNGCAAGGWSTTLTALVK